MRCGDTVKHRPTGETWEVAYADHARGLMSWWGWPEGVAQIADCDLIVTCSDAEHADAVQQWRRADAGNDHRRAMVLRLYGSTEERAA